MTTSQNLTSHEIPIEVLKDHGIPQAFYDVLTFAGAAAAGKALKNAYLALHKQQHSHNRLVRQALKYVSQQIDGRYVEVVQSFREGDCFITSLFWQFIEDKFPSKFSSVYYCRTCKKFALVEAS